MVIKRERVTLRLKRKKSKRKKERQKEEREEIIYYVLERTCDEES